MHALMNGEGIRESFLHLLSSRLETVIWTTDVALRVTSFLGGGMQAESLRPSEMVGRHVGDLFRQDAGEGTAADAHRRALCGGTVTFVMRWRERNYETYVEPLRDGKGRIVGCVGVATLDAAPVVERGGTMEERADVPPCRWETRGGPAPVCCPDVDALVAMIQGYAHMLLMRLGPTDPLRESVEEIARAGERAARQLGARRRR